ncbi:MAG: DUF1800 domain-containing protein [Hydrogenophaga sp.]|uniref:DUF1800 domain-containing protein n=1 Tax=Hydrogenophaga sp. TaxID=1904254 RepID=UPI0027164A25|nr:DUF1800 domain-containing protein [Hydrogenophaga sp.]MDO9483990.1 DUF1800 domain-containing protein [Hydrogenophaga sp.]MDP3342983.1 DUF1800 domain-containing protein [Hydrogenophaga sp.]MDP3808243.1 DUF1800 domain-containing protein [Hydrogenophaga sp.]
MTTHTNTRRHGWYAAAALAASLLLSAQQPAQAQSVKCPNQMLQWTTSWTYSTCSAMTGEAASGVTVYIYDNTAPETGWAGLRCNNGTWQKPNSYECKGGTAPGGSSGGSTSSSSSGTGTGTATPAVAPVFAAPAQIPADIAAARLLEQATFGPTPADMALVKSMGASAWINQQIGMKATPIVPGDTGSVDPVRQRWFQAMASAPDQLRQRMIFALSQIMVVSSDKNPYANEITPWLQTLDKHAFGKFGDLLREMTLNPAMGKYLALGHSKAPSPNEDFAREVMQLFTIGLHEMNMNGSYQLDGAGKRIPTYNQTTISEMARALSGWGFANGYEDMSAPLVAREAHHDKGAKTIVRGIQLPAGQTAQQDMTAVMNALLQHPNLAPFISVRLIRHFVRSNPSGAYIQRVSTVFKNTDGDLAAVVRAILLDAEARLDQPETNSGRLKDPMLHTLSLVRALNGQVVDPKNVLWDYFLMGERLAQAPSVFSFYSPLTSLPDNPGFVGPEFQIFSGGHAIRRANFLLNMLSGNMSGSFAIEITPYVTAAKDPQALMALVNKNLLQNRMSETSRQAIGTAVFNISDMKQRALTALYLTAITAEFAVQH